MSAVEDSRALARVPLFRGLTKEELSRLNGQLHLKRVAAGTSIILSEQPGEVAYFVLRGLVETHIEHPNGTYIILGILGPGEMIGEMGLVDNLGHSATAVAKEDTILVWMDRAAFWNSLSTMPQMAHNLIRIFSFRLRIAHRKIQLLATMDVYRRIGQQILAFAQEYGEASTDGAVHIPIRLTQSDLAGMVGASRVRVNQVLAAYKRRNYIEIDQNHHITILNVNALAVNVYVDLSDDANGVAWRTTLANTSPNE